MIDLQTLTISYGKKVLVDSVNAEFARVRSTVSSLRTGMERRRCCVRWQVCRVLAWTGASFWMRCRVRVRERSVL